MLEMISYKLSRDYSVASQISKRDVYKISAAGFKAIICNRPDYENPDDLRSASIKAAALDSGLKFAENVFDDANFSSDKIALQTKLLKELPGPVLAYCRSGTRSSVIWAFLKVGTMDIDKILAATEQAGYHLAHLRPQLEKFALNQTEEKNYFR